ncbi:glutamyl-tRNA(Gln) amidotransferase subunit C, mitochondrial isoform X3 [Narcine bancroftii]|uniref:glutamyl-tRNA(Gln) amidotransferase subunit C, mitochondrial isoform X3 n=1 Tax=Narcine bancroftii TaxID=1343680 RepID=UPI003831FB6A
MPGCGPSVARCRCQRGGFLSAPRLVGLPEERGRPTATWRMGRCPDGGGARWGTRVPKTPTWTLTEHNQSPEVSMEMIDHLECLALVDFRNQEGVQRLASAIQFANQLHVVDTEEVEPMDSVLENRPLYLRADEVTDGDCTEAVLSNARQAVEEYFVAPPGNIPLRQKKEGDGLQHSKE